MPLSAGTRLGPYEILSALGAGGMGEVYRAHDTKLNRDVALKVLPAQFAFDPERLARFKREAQIIASLNHANIAQIYGFEDSSGVHALVMELIEGPTLADRIAKGPIPLDETLVMAKQIAEALEAAHEQGIIHRDLKPANIKVRSDGAVKVLDFGLAKALDRGVDGAQQFEKATTVDATVPGFIIGTPAYMAPEQAKGRPVDRRADLWAFGCVLFEMLSGRRAFDDDSLPGLLVKVLDRDPDWEALPENTPPSIHTLLRRCLEKDPRRRLDSAAAARIEIDETLNPARGRRRDFERGTRDDAGSHPSSQGHTRSFSKQMAGLVGAALIAVTAGFWFLARREEPSASEVPQLHSARQVSFVQGVESYPTWSPDGMRLAFQSSDVGYYYVGNHDIWVAQLGIGEPVNLTKGDSANDRMPSWSPDGREIAFFSDRGGVWGLYTVASIGGNPRRVLALPGIGNLNWSAPQWSRDGTRIFVSVREADNNVVIILSLPTLDSSRVNMPSHDGNVCWDLSVSPDGRRFAYVEGGAGATEVTRLWTIAASGGEAVPLTDGRTNVWSPTWSPDGRKVFFVSNRGGSMDLWQQAVAENGMALGEPLAVTHGLGIRSAAFSPDSGKLAYTRGGRVANLWRVPLFSDRPATWAEAKQLTSEHAYIEFVDVSPDATRLALSSDRRGNQDLWVMPADGGEMTPLTTDSTPDWDPRWSPDGSEIVFYAYRSGNRDLWAMPSHGGPARQLTLHPGQDTSPSWSPNAREIAFRSAGTSTTSIVSANGGEPRRLADGASAAEWFPDGESLLVAKANRFYRVAKDGGVPVLLAQVPEVPNSFRLSRDGQSVYYLVFTGPQEKDEIWRLSLKDGKVSRVTRLDGRRGHIAGGFAVDSRYLYFSWSEDDGDIWVMDVTRGTQ